MLKKIQKYSARQEKTEFEEYHGFPFGDGKWSTHVLSPLPVHTSLKFEQSINSVISTKIWK